MTKNAKFFIKIFFLSMFLAAPNLALGQAIPITTDSRIKTLVFNPNEVFELKFFYGYQSFIEFADSEEIEMISIGESFAWKITPAGKRLFIRPLEIAAHTNMTVITSKRTYHFDIKSGEYDGKADEELVYTVRFYYPQVGQALPIPPQLRAPAPPKARQGQLRTPQPTVRIDDDVNDPKVLALYGNPANRELNLNFSMAGESVDLMPLKVYDDGKRTFFQFKNNNSIVPTISMVDPFGTETPLSYVIENDYVVVGAVARQFTLRLANGLICIYNNTILQGK